MDIVIFETGSVVALLNPLYNCETEEEAAEVLDADVWKEDGSKNQFVFKKTFSEDSKLGKILWAIRDYDGDTEFSIELGELIGEIFEAGKRYGQGIALGKSAEAIKD
ncbi:MAG: hypothetical protein Q8L10_02990 [Candidatus Moranbacteria bacterium]|nr:hypothetical protein [Candidatus Moranbacteria bacterium]